MSLLYDANGDIATIASITPTSGVTIASWFYTTSDTNRQQVFLHATDDNGIAWRGDLAGDPFDAYQGGGTYGAASANAASFSTYALNKWLCIVFRSPAGVNATLWMGDETTTPAAPSAYTTQTALVTPNVTSQTVGIGNQSLSTARWLRGRIGAYAYWLGTALTDAEVAAWWRDPWGYRAERGATFTSPSLWGRPGINSTTDVPDEMGGTAATVTGLSSADRDPRIVFPSAVLHPPMRRYAPLLIR
jgi:hypothetical protein